MRCDRCRKEIKADEAYQHSTVSKTENLCEDCYIDVMGAPHVCDPWDTRLAERTRAQMGQSEEEGLSDTQKKILHFIIDKKRTTIEEISQGLDLSITEVKDEIIVLRRLEMALEDKCKEDSVVHIIPWEKEEKTLNPKP